MTKNLLFLLKLACVFNIWHLCALSHDKFLELLYLIAFIGVLAVAYSYLLSGQIISSSAGNSGKEIAEAIQIVQSIFK